MSIRSIKNSISKLLIKATGDMQVFKHPLFLILCGSVAYQIKGEQQRDIIDLLKPGDILLRRYDHYLAAFFIPGYYTHVALYCGDNQIVHATTHKVGTEDILTFLRTDHIAILRPICGEDVKLNAIDTALKKIGCDYDYLFDNDVDEKFYCSELISYAYDYVYPSNFSKLKAIYPDHFLKCDKLESIYKV